MANDGQIVVELILDDGQILKALGRVKQEADNVKKGMEDDSGGGFLSKKIGDISVGVAALGVAAFKAFDLLKSGFDHSVAAARESQKAIDDLSTALAVNGKYSEQAVTGFLDYASSLSKVTGVNDDVITQNASLLASLGKLSGEGLEKATKASLDLAAGIGKDATVGFRLMAQAAEGNVAGLSRYGIKVDESATKSEKMAQVLAQVNTKFGDLAALRGDTFEGSINKLSNAFDDLYKAFGQMIVQSPVLRALITFVADAVNQFAESVKAATGPGKDLFGDFIKGALVAGKAINDYVLYPLEVLFKALVTGVSVIATAFFGLNLIFAKVQNALIEYIIAPITTFFGETLGSFVGQFAPEMGANITNAFASVSTSLIDTSKLTVDTIGNLYDASLSTTIDAANATFEGSVTTMIDGVLTKTMAVAENAKSVAKDLKAFSDQNQQEMLDNGISVGDAFGQIFTGFENSAASFAAKASENFKKVGDSMFQALGNGASQAFAAFGKALVKGDNALKAFLDSLLASFGAALIQMGTMFILQGIAYTYAGMANGPPLIAAGAALSVFGGILSALGGGGGASAGAAASSGGGGGAVNSLDNPTATLEQPQPAQAQDKITVNIQGDVLDSDETGGRIVNLLSAYADKNGNGAVVT